MLELPGVVSDPSHSTIEMTLELDPFFPVARIPADTSSIESWNDCAYH